MLVIYLLSACYFKAAPAKITSGLKKTDCKEGDEVTFICKLDKEGAKVKWLKDGKEIKPDKKYKIVSDGKVHKLIIKGADKDDEAEYTMQVVGGEETSAPLVVQGKYST